MMVDLYMVMFIIFSLIWLTSGTLLVICLGVKLLAWLFDRLVT